MVKGTLLGPEPSTFSSQRAHCLSASRLAPLSSCYASICHSSLGPVPTLSTSCLFLFFSFFRLHSIHLSPWSTFPPPVFICPPPLVFPYRCGVSFSPPIHSIMDPSLVSPDTQQISHSLLPSLHPLSCSRCVL